MQLTLSSLPNRTLRILRSLTSSFLLHTLFSEPQLALGKSPLWGKKQLRPFFSKLTGIYTSLFVRFILI